MKSLEVFHHLCKRSNLSVIQESSALAGNAGCGHHSLAHSCPSQALPTSAFAALEGFRNTWLQIHCWQLLSVLSFFHVFYHDPGAASCTSAFSPFLHWMTPANVLMGSSRDLGMYFTSPTSSASCGLNFIVLDFCRQ